MAFVGSLVATVKANTSNYKRGMKESASITQKFKSVLKSGGIAAGAFGAALLTGAAVALVAYTVKAFKAIDATAKLGRQLEITTSDLKAYELAAGLSGVSQAELNKGLEKMARTVGEARSGITTGTKALEDFGIELRDLEGLTTAEVFEKFADEISKIEDPLERAAKASLIFGRAGGKLLNFLAMGSEGFADVREEVDALGLSFNEVDAKKIEDANDAMLKMTTVFEGIGTTLAVEVAPLITEIAEKSAEWIKESGGIDKIVKSNLEDLIPVLEAVKVGYDLAAEAAGFLKSVVEAVVPGAKLFADEAKKAAGEESERMEALKDAAEAAAKAAEQADADSLKESIKLRGDLIRKIEEQNEVQKKLAEEADKEAAQRQKDLDKLNAEAQRIFDETRTPLENVTAEIERIIELLDKGVDDALIGGLDRKLAQLREVKENIIDEMTVKKGEMDAEDIGEAIAEKALDPFEEMVRRIESLTNDITTGAIETAKFGGFRELDLQNFDIAGIDRAGDIPKKTLTEAEKQTVLLQDILETNAIGDGGAFTT